jgi:hypothetical protein
MSVGKINRGTYWRWKNGEERMYVNVVCFKTRIVSTGQVLRGSNLHGIVTLVCPDHRNGNRI